MSLVDILPDIQSLSRADKLRLIRFLAQELVEAEAPRRSCQASRTPSGLRTRRSQPLRRSSRPCALNRDWD
jgi:hypothetical protein